MKPELTRKQFFMMRLHQRYREKPTPTTMIEVLEELVKSLGATQEEIDSLKEKTYEQA